jgi:probable phosphoglycerate mutase
MIRHGSVDAIGKWLAGRSSGLHLNGQGALEAERVATRLQGMSIAAIYSSPLERTQDTAAMSAQALNLRVQSREEFNEIDFGQWTEKSFEQLQEISEWHEFNRSRSKVSIPEGETMPAVSTRVVRGLELLRGIHPNDCIAIFSHADVIRVAIAYYIGLPLDFITRIDVQPASVSVLKVEDSGGVLMLLNDTHHLSMANHQADDLAMCRS